MPTPHAANLAWLLRLRWIAIVSQLIAVLVAAHAFQMRVALVPLLVIVAAEVVSNLAARMWLTRHVPQSDLISAVVMMADFVALTGLLYLTGGPFNPLSILYLVNLTLAAMILARRTTLGLLVFALACFGALFAFDAGAAGLSHADEMYLHLRGMWAAFALAASLIVYFVTRLTRALRDREAELLQAQRIAERKTRLASLATLAAGAAHELATPLSTIAMVSRELMHALEQAQANPDLRDDAALIRQEVERCRGILQSLARNAGDAPLLPAEDVSIATVLGQACENLPGAERVQVQGATEVVLSGAPRQALAQVIRTLVKNALEADGAQPVEVAATESTQAFTLTVSDKGPVIDPKTLARLGEPFFTTKPTGAGMGLGLFVALGVVDELGGSLTFTSTPKEGTRATLLLPKSSHA